LTPPLPSELLRIDLILPSIVQDLVAL
jgi:hypothetical protein